MPAQLKFCYGPMDCAKSTLALQIDHNHARQGRQGLLLTRYDRSGGLTITRRVGRGHRPQRALPGGTIAAAIWGLKRSGDS